MAGVTPQTAGERGMLVPVLIRPARAEDARAIGEIWNPVIRDSTITFDPDEKSEAEIAALVAARQAGTSAFLVAEDRDGGVGGFVTCTQFRNGRGYARTLEHSVHVRPGLRGHGVGRALMGAIEEHAAKAGATSLWAGVSGTNAAGRAFHARLGFETVAVLPQVGWKFDRALDLVLMRKPTGRPDSAGGPR